MGLACFLIIFFIYEIIPQPRKKKPRVDIRCDKQNRERQMMRDKDFNVPRGPIVVEFDAKKKDICEFRYSDEEAREKRQCLEAINARVKECNIIMSLAESRLRAIKRNGRTSVFLHEMFDASDAVSQTEPVLGASSTTSTDDDDDNDNDDDDFNDLVDLPLTNDAPGLPAGLD
eukprot:scaffold23003_cov37-Attheya_sp.AAC.3